jgi:adenosylcobinamide kinase/adenosylcobinamide-phosphate guanylyltransferase
VETVDLPAVLGRPGPPVLVDCLTTWLARVMDECGIWAKAPEADARLAEAVERLVAAWTATRRRVVAVSNEVGSGVVPATPSGRRFRDELGVLNARFAAASPRVWLVTAGLPQRLR